MSLIGRGLSLGLMTWRASVGSHRSHMRCLDAAVLRFKGAALSRGAATWRAVIVPVTVTVTVTVTVISMPNCSLTLSLMATHIPTPDPNCKPDPVRNPNSASNTTRGGPLGRSEDGPIAVCALTYEG